MLTVGGRIIVPPWPGVRHDYDISRVAWNNLAGERCTIKSLHRTYLTLEEDPANYYWPRVIFEASLYAAGDLVKLKYGDRLTVRLIQPRPGEPDGWEWETLEGLRGKPTIVGSLSISWDRVHSFELVSREDFHAGERQEQGCPHCMGNPSSRYCECKKPSVSEPEPEINEPLLIPGWDHITDDEIFAYVKGDILVRWYKKWTIHYDGHKIPGFVKVTDATKWADDYLVG